MITAKHPTRSCLPPSVLYFSVLLGIPVGMYCLCKLFNLTGGLLFLECTIIMVLSSLFEPLLANVFYIFSSKGKK